MISDEVVEVALEVFWANEDETYHTAMKRALEAAAPHMLAPVTEVADRLASTELTGDNYHQGRASGFRMAAEHIRQATNPYRSQA